MTRRLLSFWLGACLLALLPALDARAVEMPVRKAGLWEMKISGLPRDSTTTIEAKWLGACKPDQKPGDIVMPGGFKINIKDAEKLKGLMPK